jgi:hypothetical protein
MYRELGNRLKMPNSLEAHMEMKVDFPGITATGWRTIFPSFEWHVSEDLSTQVGLMLNPAGLNQALSMNVVNLEAVGCSKLVLPATALVGRSVLAYAPPFKVWCKEDAESGAVLSILTGFLVILDESGELRTPPNHSYTDEEETLIQETLRENVEKMRSSEMPISPLFLRLLGHPQEAAEVQTALEEKLEARKRRRLGKSVSVQEEVTPVDQVQQEVMPEAEEVTQKDVTEEVTPVVMTNASTDAPT